MNEEMDKTLMKELERHARHIGAKLEKARKMASERVPVAGTMHKVLPPGERDTAKIDYKECLEREIMLDNLGAALGPRPDRICPPGTYTRLLTKRVPEDPTNSEWCVMMTDAPYEIRSSMEFIENARGNVLVAGLGLGATLLPVLRKHSVKTVLVLEKNPDVIALVSKHILRQRGGKKLAIEQADAHTWRPGKRFARARWDTIWLDIWPDVSVGNLIDMRALRRRFARWVAPKGWIGVWEWNWLHQQDAEIARSLDEVYAAVGGRDLSKWPPKGDKIKIDGQEVKL